MENQKKYFLQCQLCNQKIDHFKQWFRYAQRCPECGSNRADIKYLPKIPNLNNLIHHSTSNYKGLWYYYDFLPLDSPENIITGGEGIVPIDRWSFIEAYAKDVFKIKCKVYAHRHDNNYATGTFKDLAGSVVSSVLHENAVKNYVVASTGNIGVAYSRYLSAANITIYAFIPNNSSKTQEAEISCFGQKVFRVDGDYHKAKELALEFAQQQNYLLAAGNFDPMRIEAKKTMMFEWIRLLEDFPTVYIQALSGGTGPLAIKKGCEDLSEMGLNYQLPRFILVQSNKCPPMADAWKEAKNKKFPEGWENDYPIYSEPDTIIPTLATGYPKTYPVLSQYVRESKGEIISFNELLVADVASLIAYETSVRMGPAAAIAVGGLFQSLKKGYIKDGDVILINVGEGIRRSPDFMERLIQSSEKIESLDAVQLFDRLKYRDNLWNKIDRIVES